MRDFLKESAFEILCFGVSAGVGYMSYSFVKNGRNIIESIEVSGDVL